MKRDGYMRKHALPAVAIASLMAEPETCFADQEGMAGASRQARLHRTRRHPQSGADRHRGSTVGQRSGAQIPVRRRGAERRCRAVQRRSARAVLWVHAERLVHKLDTFTDKHRAAQTRVRGLIWDYYASLKAYRKLKPGPRRAAALRARFDRIFLRRTGSGSRWTACSSGCMPTRRSC